MYIEYSILATVGMEYLVYNGYKEFTQHKK